MTQGHKCERCVSSIPTRGNEIFISLYIFILFVLVWGQSAALSSAIKQEMPSELGGKWGTESFSTSLCLSCSVHLFMFVYIYTYIHCLIINLYIISKSIILNIVSLRLMCII